MHEKEGERIDWASNISTLKALNAKRIQRQDLKMTYIATFGGKAASMFQCPE